MEVSDQELLDLALQGDGSAFAVLVGRYEIPLRGYFRRRRVEDEDAGDLLQEVFLRVFRYAASYDPAKRLGSWIFSIASNLFKDRVASERRRNEHEAASDPGDLAVALRCERPGPEAMALRSEVRGDILVALSRLSDQHRAVFMLKHYYGLRYEEIARILGCSVGTVKSRMHYACLKLQERLSREGHGPFPETGEVGGGDP